MPKGYIIKFDEKTNNPYFPERTFPSKRKPPRVDIPYWAICEPRIRSKLVFDDKLFFAPQRTFLVKGVIVVDKNVSGKEAKQILGEDWYEFYKAEVCEHSGLPRSGNVIVGNPVKSFWTKNGVDLKWFSRFLSPQMFDAKRQRNNIKKFTDEDQAEKIYHELRQGSRSL